MRERYPPSRRSHCGDTSSIELHGAARSRDLDSNVTVAVLSAHGDLHGLAATTAAFSSTVS